MSLSVGIMHQVWGTAEEPHADILGQVLEDVALADELGYDSVWLAEHHLRRPAKPFYGRLPDEAVRLAESAAWRIYDAQDERPPDSHRPGDVDDLFAQVFYVVGTPETVATKLDHYMAQTGINALNIMPHGPGVAPEAVRRCMKLFAEEVVPRLSSVRHDLAA
jgi:alkanesulfonate monooxygenase SsuD/methylene tetrahydromethanopterin reductase-like flavin-dependent oxidoreductase (luciferase family)